MREKLDGLVERTLCLIRLVDRADRKIQMLILIQTGRSRQTHRQREPRGSGKEDRRPCRGEAQVGGEHLAFSIPSYPPSRPNYHNLLTRLLRHGTSQSSGFEEK